MTKRIITYSIILVLGLALLQWLKISYMSTELSFEVYIGVIALLFLVLGYFLSPKRLPPSGEPEGVLEDPKIYSISSREMEVLKYMEQGLSNEEIAEKMFVSLPTVKTHCYNLYKKLEVKRRTQAVAKAKVLRLI